MALVPAIQAQVRAQAGGTRPAGGRQLSRVCSPPLGTGSTLMIVTEYMSLGALDGFLRVSGVGPGGGNDLAIFGPLLFFVGTWS